MKKLIKLSLILTLGLSLIGCSAGAKTEEIKDTTALTQMDTVIKENIKSYFDVEVPTDLAYEYNALKRFIPSQEDPKTDVHHANIFQAAHKTKEPIPGQLLGYGGVLTPDNTGITGLIINIAPAKDATLLELSEADLQTIGIDFLKNSGLAAENETVSFIEVNQKASSKSVMLLNFETDSKMYAVGIDLLLGQAVYFEYVDKLPAQE